MTQEYVEPKPTYIPDYYMTAQELLTDLRIIAAKVSKTNSAIGHEIEVKTNLLAAEVSKIWSHITGDS